MVHAHYLLGALHFEGEYYRHKDTYIVPRAQKKTKDNQSDIEEKVNSPNATASTNEGESQQHKLAGLREKAVKLKRQLEADEDPTEVAVKDKGKIVNGVKAVEYLKTAAKYRHTAASFLLAQIYYEGRGDKGREAHYVKPDLGISYVILSIIGLVRVVWDVIITDVASPFPHNFRYFYFKRIATAKHSSSSLEPAFDAYDSGNTSLALFLYLLHAEMGSEAARMNALFLLDVNTVLAKQTHELHPKPSNEHLDAQVVTDNEVGLSNAARAWKFLAPTVLDIAQKLPFIGAHVPRMLTPQLFIHSSEPDPTTDHESNNHPPGGARNSVTKHVDARLKAKLLRQFLEHAIAEGSHDAKRILGDYFLYEASRACFKNNSFTGTNGFFCRLQYHYFAYASFRQSIAYDISFLLLLLFFAPICRYLVCKVIPCFVLQLLEL